MWQWASTISLTCLHLLCNHLPQTLLEMVTERWGFLLWWRSCSKATHHCGDSGRGPKEVSAGGSVPCLQWWEGLHRASGLVRSRLVQVWWLRVTEAIYFSGLASATANRVSIVCLTTHFTTLIGPGVHFRVRGWNLLPPPFPSDPAFCIIICGS